MPLKKVEQQALQKLETDSLDDGGIQALLHEAAEKGWSAVVRACLNSGAQADAKSLRLASAVKSDSPDCVRALLEGGADPNESSVLNTCGPASVSVLVAAGADLNRRAWDGLTPLIAAISKRRKDDKALLLIELGADVDAPGKEGRTPLMHASAMGRTKVFDALLANGADPLIVDDSGRSAMRYALESICGCSTVQRLHPNRKGALRNARKMRDALPAQPEDVVLLTVVLDDVAELRRQLKAGLNPNSLFAGGIGFLGITWQIFGDPGDQQLRSGLSRVADDPSLLKRAKRDDGARGTSNLLMWAVMSGATKCAKLLLKSGADPDSETETGMSAAKLASQFRPSFEGLD